MKGIQNIPNTHQNLTKNYQLLQRSRKIIRKQRNQQIIILISITVVINRPRKYTYDRLVDKGISKAIKNIFYMLKKVERNIRDKKKIGQYK